MGTALAMVFVVMLMVSGNLWFLVAAPIAGCGLAWAALFFIERNPSAIFRYPVWSLKGDFQIFALFCTQRMETGLRRYGIDT